MALGSKNESPELAMDRRSSTIKIPLLLKKVSYSVALLYAKRKNGRVSPPPKKISPLSLLVAVASNARSSLDGSG